VVPFSYFFYYSAGPSYFCLPFLVAFDFCSLTLNMTLTLTISICSICTYAVDGRSLGVAVGTPSLDVHAGVHNLEGAARRLGEVVCVGVHVSVGVDVGVRMGTHAVEEQSRVVVESSQLLVRDRDGHEVADKNGEVAEREVVDTHKLVEVARSLVVAPGVKQVGHGGGVGSEVAGRRAMEMVGWSCGVVWEDTLVGVLIRGSAGGVGCEMVVGQCTQDAAMMCRMQVHAAHVEVPQVVVLRNYVFAARRQDLGLH